MITGQRLLSEMKVARGALDNSADMETPFGAIIVDHSKVSSKVIAKYDVSTASTAGE